MVASANVVRANEPGKKKKENLATHTFIIFYGREAAFTGRSDSTLGAGGRPGIAGFGRHLALARDRLALCGEYNQAALLSEDIEYKDSRAHRRLRGSALLSVGASLGRRSF